MSDMHPRNMWPFVVALMLSAFRPAGADTADTRQHVALHPVRPTQSLTLARVAQDQGHYSTFLAAVKAAELDNWLSGKSHYTVLMPSDAAFAKLPGATRDALLNPANRGLLIQFVKAHMLTGDRHAKDVARLRTARTVEGERLEVAVADGIPTQFGAAHVVDNERPASNGVMYGIDTVLIPASLATELQRQGNRLRAQAPTASFRGIGTHPN